MSVDEIERLLRVGMCSPGRHAETGCATCTRIEEAIAFVRALALPADPPTPPTERERALVEEALRRGHYGLGPLPQTEVDAIVRAVDCTHPRAEAPAEPRYSRADVERVAEEVYTLARTRPTLSGLERAAIVARVLGAPSEVEAAERRVIEAVLRWGIAGPPDGTSASQRAMALMDARDALRAARENAGGAARVGAPSPARAPGESMPRVAPEASAEGDVGEAICGTARTDGGDLCVRPHGHDGPHSVMRYVDPARAARAEAVLAACERLTSEIRGVSVDVNGCIDNADGMPGRPWGGYICSEGPDGFALYEKRADNCATLEEALIALGGGRE